MEGDIHGTVAAGQIAGLVSKKQSARKSLTIMRRQLIF